MSGNSNRIFLSNALAEGFGFRRGWEIILIVASSEG